MNIFISLKLTTQIEKPWIMRVLNHNLTRWLVTLIFIIGLILYFFLLPVSYSQSVWQRTGGPYGDTVYYIAVHPFSQDTIVAGNDEKLYLTTDGGKAWSLITSIPGYVLSLITVPTNPPAFYCGTEWQGIFLSLDSGKSWEKMSSMRALTFAFDPNNPERIFAGSDSGKILVTNDHGRNWKKINTGSDASIRSISVSPQDTNTIFAGTRGNFYDIGDGLYKTIDGGKTWQKKLSLNSSVTAIEIDPSNFFYIYVGSVEEGIFKSIDGGENWEETIDGLPEHIMIYSLLSNLDQTYHFFAGTDQGIYVKATDGNWSPFDIGVETSHFSTITKAHPESSNLFIGCPFGLLKGDVSSDKFHTIGVNFITISDILVDYHKPDVLFAIGRSIYKSTNSGVTWDLFNYGVLGPNQAGVIAIDPSNPHVLYSGFYGNHGVVYKSIDHGANWTATPLRDVAVNDLVVAPSNSNIIYACGLEDPFVGAIFKSQDGGVTWDTLSIDLLDNDAVLCLAVDPSNENIVFAGTRQKGVFKTTDGGSNWLQTNNGLPTPRQFFGDIQDISLDFQNMNIVYTAVGGGGIYKSENSGNSWFSANEGLANYDVRSIVIDPEDTQIIFAGTFGGGVFQSTDGGKAWTPMNEGWGAAAVSSLELDFRNRILYASTFNGGVWNYKPLLVNVERKEEANQPKEIRLFQNFPNPFNPSTTISYSIGQPEFVSLKIYDTLGKEIKTLINRYQSQGKYTVNFDAGEFASGIYFCKLKAGNFTTTKKMLIVR